MFVVATLLHNARESERMYVPVLRVDGPKAKWHLPIPVSCFCYHILLLLVLLLSQPPQPTHTGNEAYTRFWNALTDTHQMMAAWLEAASSVVAFSRSGSRWPAFLAMRC